MQRSLVCFIVAYISHSPAQELSSKWRANPINASVLIPAERGLLLILVIMFLAGLALAYSEVVRWWKARIAQYYPPPLANLITYVRDSDGSWHPTHVLWFSLPPLEKKVTPEELLPSVQSVQEDRPKKAA